ncbi:hypothetical protein F5148DRAFT_1149045 [Russula earlei]|uniref:Uncharacterized protein n=1 Tax=Russula earlei TaxID=71964 RepID=A0ACC0UBD3_9AGAM|nr:hypothetical protein F5148DRAFT_1149045 [Russula earlei]
MSIPTTRLLHKVDFPDGEDVEDAHQTPTGELKLPPRPLSKVFPTDPCEGSRRQLVLASESVLGNRLPPIGVGRKRQREVPIIALALVKQSSCRTEECGGRALTQHEIQCLISRKSTYQKPKVADLRHSALGSTADALLIRAEYVQSHLYDGDDVQAKVVTGPTWNWQNVLSLLSLAPPFERAKARCPTNVPGRPSYIRFQPVKRAASLNASESQSASDMIRRFWCSL